MRNKLQNQESERNGSQSQQQEVLEVLVADAGRQWHRHPILASLTESEGRESMILANIFP